MVSLFGIDGFGVKVLGGSLMELALGNLLVECTSLSLQKVSHTAAYSPWLGTEGCE